MKFNYLIFAVLLALLTSCYNDANVKNTDTDRHVAFSEDQVHQGVVCVKLKPEVEESLAIETRGDGFTTNVIDLDQLAASIGASKIEKTFRSGGKYAERHRKAGLHLWYDIHFDENTPVTKAVGSLADRDDLFSYVEPVYVRTIDAKRVEPFIEDDLIRVIKGESLEAPHPSGFNDPDLDRQWHYYNAGGVTGKVEGADINVIPAWKKTTGHPDVIVCIVDGGIKQDHPDLIANLWQNKIELNGTPGVDDDDNGFIDDFYGWDFASNDNTIEGHFHGTHVAGTVAAVNNNGIGVAGVAGGDGTPNSGVKLMSAQSSSNPLSIYVVNAAKGIVYGADSGAVISQNSWGGSKTTISQNEKEAIEYFMKYAGMDETGEIQIGPMRGGIVIFAAGNDDTSDKVMPGGYDAVVSVASMGSNFKKAWYSNYGDWIDVTAPGGDSRNNFAVYSTCITLGEYQLYDYMDGTSMACPHVSGIAALIVSKEGVGKSNFTNQKLRELIEVSVNDIDEHNPVYAGKLGRGYIDAGKALNGGDVVDTPELVSDLSGEWGSNAVTFTWSVTKNSKDVKATSYAVCVSKKELTNLNFSNPPVGAKKEIVMVGDANVGDKLTIKLDDIKNNSQYYVGIAGYNEFGVRSEALIVHGNPAITQSLPEYLYFDNRNAVETIDFSEYITGINIPLTYSISYDESLLTVENEADNKYKFTSKAFGNSELEVRVVDSKNQSTTVIIKAACRDGNSAVELYPNPMKDVMNVRMGETVEGFVDVTIYNAKGVEVLLEKITVKKYEPTPVNVSKLSSGTYVVSLSYIDPNTNKRVEVKRNIIKL